MNMKGGSIETHSVGQLFWALWLLLLGGFALAVGCGWVMESVRQHAVLLLPHLGRPLRLGAHYLIHLSGPDAFARIPVFLLICLAPWVPMVALAARLPSSRTCALVVKFGFMCCAISLFTIALTMVSTYMMLEQLVPLIPVLPGPYRTSSGPAVAILIIFILVCVLTALHIMIRVLSGKR